MKGLLGGRGARLAVAALTTAALLAGAPAQGAENLYSLRDPSGDAHAATPLCAVDCSGAPTPVSEPSIDVRRVQVDRDGGNLVVQWKVVDLDHVPLAQPEDTVGYQIGFFVGDDLAVTVMAQRTAAHGSSPTVVIATDYTTDSRRAISASFDHATDVVRATVPLAVLNDAVADVCASCHVDASDLTYPFVMTYVLATTPLGPTGPVYQDIVRATESPTVMPTADGWPTWHYGGGPFTGTLSYHPPSAACPETNVPIDLEITATIAVSNGMRSYAGPVTLEGRGCGWDGTVVGDDFSLHGTDALGATLDCPDLSGMVLGIALWTGSFGGACTLDGYSLPRANPVLFGKWAPTGVDDPLGSPTFTSGAAIGVMSFSAFGES